MTTALTEIQAAILETVIFSLLERQTTPTYREIGEVFGINSTNGVAQHLRALERNGYIDRLPFEGRGSAISRNLRVLRWPDGAAFVLRAERAA